MTKHSLHPTVPLPIWESEDGERWINIYPNNKHGAGWQTRAMADSFREENRLYCIHIIPKPKVRP